MKTVSQEIKEVLGEFHIEDGSKTALNLVCKLLSDRLSDSSLYKMGYMEGKADLQEDIKDLLNIRQDELS